MTGNIAHASDFTIDVGGAIKLDADSSNIYLADGGTDIALLSTNNSDLNIRNLIADKDIYFQGSDGGSVITALTLDMSAAGDATFAGNVSIADDKQLIMGNSSDFTLKHHPSGYGHVQNTGTLYIDAETIDLRTDNSSISSALTLSANNIATFSGSVSANGDVESKGGNELRVYRTDNNAYGSIEYLTGAGGLKLRDVNGDGMTFAGASSNYLTIAGTGAATFSGSVTSSTTGNTFTHGTSWGTNLTLTNTNDDISPPIVSFQKLPASGYSAMADNDYLGFINFRANNSANQTHSWVEIAAFANDVTDGSEDSSLKIGTWGGGTEYGNTLMLKSGKVGIGTSSIDSDSILHLKSTQPNIYFEDTDDAKSWRLEAGSVFKLQNVTTSSEVFRIDQSGNLLVNGATSNAKLSVKGAASLRAQNVQVAVDGHTAIGFFNASGTDVGGIAIGSSGASISLGGNAAANTLDDYEEGLWTPVLDGSSSVSGQSYATQNASYTKVGRQVTANFHIQFTNKGTIAGVLRISGLPFTGFSTPSYQAATIMSGKVTLDADQQLTGMQYAENNFIYLMIQEPNQAFSQPNTNILNNDTEIAGSVTYFTNS